MSFSLIPKNDVYFADFDELVSIATEIVLLFKDGVSADEIARDLPARAKILERRGDEVVRRCSARLNESFITPIEREDIVLLIDQLDNISDSVEGAIDRFEMYAIHQPTAELRAFADVLYQMVERIGAAVKFLRTLDPTTVREELMRVHELEEKGDEIFRQAMRDLFARRPEAYDLIRWKEVYEVLEDACDHCYDVARTVFHVLVRHS